MKKSITMFLAAAMSAILLAGCSAKPEETTAAESVTETTAAETTVEETTAAETAAEAADETDSSAIRVTALKGPTTMGLVHLMDLSSKGETDNNYEISMVTAPDELTAMIGSGKTDIALLPANVASVLYNKTQGKVTVIDVNTLGVLYLVSAGEPMESAADLKGRTVYLPGKGSTPEFVLRYLISKAGLTEEDVTLEFKSEAAEVAAVLAEDPEALGLLPQPFVTVAMAKNDKLSIVMDLTAEWNKLQADGEKSQLITGVTIANTEFLNNNKEAVDAFLADHKVSIDFTAEDPAAAAELIAAQGIVPKAPIAQKALPFCNIHYMDGEEMKEALSGYLTALSEQNPASIGGAVPDDAFYYLP